MKPIEETHPSLKGKRIDVPDCQKCSEGSAFTSNVIQEHTVDKIPVKYLIKALRKTGMKVVNSEGVDVLFCLADFIKELGLKDNRLDWKWLSEHIDDGRIDTIDKEVVRKAIDDFEMSAWDEKDRFEVWYKRELKRKLGL